MKTLKSSSVFLILALAAVESGAASHLRPQNPPGQNAQAPSAAAGQNKSAPAIRTTTRLIQVSVLVHDKHGDPVAGLNKNDFTILDDKEQQTIQLFSVETNLPPEHLPAPLPADTYSNRVIDRGAAPKNVSVVLLDSLNTEYSDQIFARSAVIKFLQQIQPQDRVGIYTLGDKLAVLHDFTTDSAALLDALKKYQGRPSPELSASTPHELSMNPMVPSAQAANQLDSFLRSSSQREANFYTTNRVLLTVEAFELIAHHVLAVPGRKNLVWISGSFPINFGFDDLTQPTITPMSEQLQFQAQVEKAARALNDANIAIYPVDARGLMGYSTSLTSSTKPRSSMPGGSARTGSGLAGRPNMIKAPTQAEFASMAILADRTGGRAFYNTNDLFKAIRTAVDDSRVTYELGYYPTNSLWDGKFHEIKVMVNKPGVSVRARKGYFAVPDPRTAPEDEKAAIFAAATSPLEATTIGLKVEVMAITIPGAEGMKTVLHFDPNEISFRQEDGRFKGAVEALYAQLSEEGKILNAPAETFNLAFTPERYEHVLKAGLSKTMEVPIVAGANELRVILVDKNTGAIGCVSIPVKPYFPELGKKN